MDYYSAGQAAAQVADKYAGSGDAGNGFVRPTFVRRTLRLLQLFFIVKSDS